MRFSVIKRIDNLGRVVVPIEMRRCYEIDTNDELEFIPLEDGILLRKKEVKGEE